MDRNDRFGLLAPPVSKEGIMACIQDVKILMHRAYFGTQKYIASAYKALGDVFSNYRYSEIS